MSGGGVAVLYSRSPPACTHGKAFSAGSDDGSLPTCPICLTDIAELREKAVINPCMHVYHVHCLDQWLEHKKLCPLCKAKVASYFHRISKSGEYSERLLPTTPPRETEQDSVNLPLIDHARLSSSQAASSRHDFWSHPVHSRGAHYRSRGSDNRRAAAGRGPMQPRPYFHRVRAMLSAPDGRAIGAAAGSGSSVRLPDVRSVTEERSLSWRRHIYSHGLRAVPFEPSRGQLTAQAPSCHRRIEEWVTRELRALLHSDDVLLLRSFVMGLVASPQALEQEEEPQQALRPFLHNHSRHFWHELRCFARVPFSMSTYDRLVEYRSPGAPQEAGASQESQPGSSWSLWSAQQSTSAGEAHRAATWYDSRASSNSCEALQHCGHAGQDERPGRIAQSRCGSRGMCVAARGHGETGLCLDCAERAAERCTQGGGGRESHAIDAARRADSAGSQGRREREGGPIPGVSRSQHAGDAALEVINLADSPSRSAADVEVIDLSSDSEGEGASGARLDARTPERSAGQQNAVNGSHGRPHIEQTTLQASNIPGPGPESATAGGDAGSRGAQAAEEGVQGARPGRVSFMLPAPRARRAARDRGFSCMNDEMKYEASRPAGAEVEGARPSSAARDGSSRPSGSEVEGARPTSAARDGSRRPNLDLAAAMAVVSDQGGSERADGGATWADRSKASDDSEHRRHSGSRKRSRRAGSQPRSRRKSSLVTVREMHGKAHRKAKRRRTQDGLESERGHSGSAAGEGGRCEARWQMWKPGDDVA